MIICLGGKFIAIELKSSASAHVDPLQKYNLEKIKKAGGISFVAWPANWEIIFKIIKELCGERKERRKVSRRV